jgi:hypothetical protein
MFGRLSAAVVAIALACGAAGLARAQIATGPATLQWCRGGADADVSARAEAHWRSRWLQVGYNWYTAYEIRPKPRNPFDQTAKVEPPVVPVPGMIWANTLVCELSPGANPNETVARVAARGIAFFENRRWAAPLAPSVMMEVVITKGADTLTLVDRTAESGLVMPEMGFRLPALSEVPKRSLIHGLPCVAEQAWTGKRCAAPPAAKATAPKTAAASIKQR